MLLRKDGQREMLFRYRFLAHENFNQQFVQRVNEHFD